MNTNSYFKLGEKVHLLSVGPSYSRWIRPYFNPRFREQCEIVCEYALKYKPINATFITPNDDLMIRSDYDTPNDLSLRGDLTWKIRFVLCYDHIIGNHLYIISSNLNHMLVVNERAISKI